MFDDDFLRRAAKELSDRILAAIGVTDYEVSQEGLERVTEGAAFRTLQQVFRQHRFGGDRDAGRVAG